MQNLTDEQQIVINAIEHARDNSHIKALMSIGAVLTASPYRRFQTKRIILELAELGIIALHHHDFPTSVTREERRLMIALPETMRGAGRRQFQYFHALAFRES